LKKEYFATVIQTKYRQFQSFNKVQAKMERRRIAEEEGSEVYESEEEQIGGKMNSILGKSKNEFENELMNVSMKVDKKKNNSQQKSFVQGGAGMMSLAELEHETDKNKIIEQLMINNSLYKGDKNNINNSINNSVLKSGMTTKIGKNQFTQSPIRKRKIPKGGKRIEDKLIEYGENLKLKKS